MPRKTFEQLKQDVLALNKETTPIDPGIMNLLIGLKANNIPTQISCYGHSEKPWSYPYIDIAEAESFADLSDDTITSKAIRRMLPKKNIIHQQKTLNLLESFYHKRNTPLKYQITLHTFLDLGWFRLKCMGADTLQLLPSHVRIQELAKCQAEISAFGEFLILSYL